MHLLNCNSLSIIHDLEWTTAFYHLLISKGPLQNFVPGKRDFSDLEGSVKTYSSNLALAQKVADNAIATFRDRYTSPAAESCYWRRLLQGYSAVAFTPDPFVDTNITVLGEIESKKLVRGTAYEEILYNIIAD